MKALIYKKNGVIEIAEKPIPTIENDNDAIVKVSLSAICTSDLHIINGNVPNAKPGVTLGHEFVGEIISLGKNVKNLNIRDKVAANCITFCNNCYFCKRGFVNNCKEGGWELGCKIDGGQAEYVRVPYAQNTLYKIPDGVKEESALFVGDILSSGYFGAELCAVKPGDTIAVIGSGPVGLCAMACSKLLGAKCVIAIDIDEHRLNIAKYNNLASMTFNPDKCDIQKEIKQLTENRGADGVIECAGTEKTFKMAWEIARANSIVALVAMYESPQSLPLPEMYGKNLIFKTGGVDATHCKELLNYIADSKLNTDFLISKIMPFDQIQEGYKIFENKQNDILKIAVKI